MEKLYDNSLIKMYMNETKYSALVKELEKYLFVTKYKKGEFVTTPLQQENLFQIIIKGTVNIYFIRDNGSVYSLSNAKENDLLGEMELFQHRLSNVYAEANNDVICLAISIEAYKNILLKNCDFLKLICESLSQKMETITTFDASPTSLKQRVYNYMKYKCSNGKIKGLQKVATHLNCSTRQLQRILTIYELEGIIIKTGKGAYKLINE